MKYILLVLVILVFTLNIFDINPFVAKSGELAYSVKAPSAATKVVSGIGYIDFMGKAVPTLYCLQLENELIDLLDRKPVHYSEKWQRNYNFTSAKFEKCAESLAGK
ncbi:MULTISPECIES: hypothetical protein [Pseudoalteromonas]|uniref:Uncharacterized protein n=1 Tax=Pseudoalteromonas obscura TaxID=3048491 RepID=A0ABT7EJG2_9GAMM|nr:MULTISPECIES: hypothetical protein [Pseudoalteromonas]MBQ4836767.1 hypothetical protein [Pseudoalteromonas luteoviolacea]MDK2595195.1 hypothetical protein [Pseudoalteromonas sp. P94(2023)]